MYVISSGQDGVFKMKLTMDFVTFTQQDFVTDSDNHTLNLLVVL